MVASSKKTRQWIGARRGRLPVGCLGLLGVIGAGTGRGAFLRQQVGYREVSPQGRLQPHCQGRGIRRCRDHVAHLGFVADRLAGSEKAVKQRLAVTAEGIPELAGPVLRERGCRVRHCRVIRAPALGFGLRETDQPTDAAVVVSGEPNITPIFMRIWLMKITRQLAFLMLPVILRSA